MSLISPHWWGLMRINHCIKLLDETCPINQTSSCKYISARFNWVGLQSFPEEEDEGAAAHGWFLIAISFPFSSAI